jgi:hypothetical protein
VIWSFNLKSSENADGAFLPTCQSVIVNPNAHEVPCHIDPLKKKVASDLSRILIMKFRVSIASNATCFFFF